MIPDSRKLTEISIAVLLLAVLAPEADGHAEEGLGDDEVALFTRVLDIPPFTIPNFHFHTKIWALDLSAVQIFRNIT